MIVFWCDVFLVPIEGQCNLVIQIGVCLSKGVYAITTEIGGQTVENRKHV